MSQETDKNSVERFSDRVENYVKYRPNYPSEMLELFKTAMNLRSRFCDS